jgi:hypothetical protein
MKTASKVLLLASALCVLGLASDSLFAQTPSPVSQCISGAGSTNCASAPLYAAGEVLVKFSNPDTTDAEALAALQSVNATKVHRFTADGWFKVEVDPNADIPALSKQIAQIPGVVFAEPDWIGQTNLAH